MNERAIFEAALDRKDPAQRSAYLNEACSANQPLRQHIEGLLKAHEMLGSFLAAPPPALTPTVDEPIMEHLGTIIGPYKLLEQIGEGGFGVVFMAEQTTPVRRKVALKVIKPGMDTRQVIARFEAERQALALMEHPNIARVLDAGTTSGVRGQESGIRKESGVALTPDSCLLTPDAGRPYFVMELVRGTSMTEYCDQHNLPVRERLELFVDVCQAVQHAHQKGIIHRDIKPSNVLVTLHDGKPVVKVIDFGIAKAMGQQLTDKTLFTNFAQMIGTPLYMSPEQAEMSAVDADTRSDIYSLGVLLYELLTGTTPFDKERLKQAGFDEIRRIIREEEPPKPSTRMSTVGQAATTASEKRQSDPRKLSRLFRGELDWIVMKALEKDRNRRYETASAFAADVGRYLKDEAVQACPPSTLYKFRKFARRNKARLAFATVILFFLVLLGGGGGWAVRDRGARRTETERAVTEALDESANWQQEGRMPEALAAARRADLLAQAGAGDALRQRVQARRADLELVAALEDARLEMTSVKEEHFDHELKDRLYAAAFQGAGIDVENLPAEDAGDRIRGSSVATELAAALDDWAVTRSIKRPPDPSWQHLLRVARAADLDAWRDRVRDAWQRDDLQALVDLAGTEEALRQPALTLSTLVNVLQSQAGEALLREARQRHPEDFWANNALAWPLNEARPPQTEEAIRFFTVAVALRPQSPGAHLNLGVALYIYDRLDEAIGEYLEAIRLKKDYATAHMNLGTALLKKGRLDEAIAEHREAIRLKKDYALFHSNLGVALRKKGRLDEAIGEYREAIRLNKDLPEPHICLGNALGKKGRTDEAIGEYREAIRLRKDDPGAHNNLGNALMDKGRLDEAIAEFREAIRLNKDLPEAHHNLGNALMDKGRLDEAIAEYREAIRLKNEYPDAHNGLGAALKEKGWLDEAIGEYREAIRLNKDDPRAHSNLGVALKDKSRLDEAIGEYREAIRLNKDLPELHSNLGNALQEKGELDEAIAELGEAIRLKKDLPEAHYNLGIALHHKGRPDEAIAEFREAIRFKQDYASAHYNLGVALKEKRRLDEAIHEYQEALRHNKNFHEAHNNLGLALMEKGRLDEAIGEYREAIRIKPDSAEAHSNLGVVLRNKGNLVGAIAACQKAISLEPDNATAHHNLGSALMAKGDPAGAVASFQKAIALKPDLAVAHCNLGFALQAQGEFRQALIAMRHGHELGTKDPNWSFPSAQDVRACERLVELDDKLPAYLAGKATPAGVSEQIDLAGLCVRKHINHAAARFFEEAFVGEPGLAKDLAKGRRYDAACAAALAGCGQGKDANQSDDKERIRLRRQALDWLRADLDAWGELLTKDADKARPAVAQTLTHWQQDTDFAGVRGKDALAKLPEAERAEWQKLWEDVEKLRQRAAKPGAPASPARP